MMSPLVLAMLGRTFGPSIAKDLPENVRVPANVLMDPLGSLSNVLSYGLSQAYSNVTGNKTIPTQVLEIIQDNYKQRADTGDYLRQALSQMLPDQLAQIVRPNQYSYPILEDETGVIDLNTPVEPFQRFPTSIYGPGDNMPEADVDSYALETNVMAPIIGSPDYQNFAGATNANIPMGTVEMGPIENFSFDLPEEFQVSAEEPYYSDTYGEFGLGGYRYGGRVKR